MNPTEILLSVLLVYSVYYWFIRLKFRLPLPPGPKGLPIIGNAFSMPRKYEWITFHRWCVEYDTDILYLNVLGQSIVVLDRPNAVMELLEKKSSIYSSRPRFPYIQDVVGTDYITGLLKYGQKWRQHRRLIHPFFNVTASSNYTPRVLGATHRLLGRLLEKPKDIKSELHFMAADAILSVCYNIDIRTDEGAYYFEAIKKGSYALFDAIVPGKFVVDFFPTLQYVPAWLPGAGFKRNALAVRKYVNDMVNLPFDAAKRQHEDGNGSACFVDVALGDSRSPAHDEHVRDAAGTLYTAGSDSTVAALASCILGLLGRPEVIKRAQEDLDRVIRPGQLPELDDEPSLPFITAIAKEALRWREAAPLAIPHYVDEEQEYRGYRIPAKSIVLGNTWALLHDEDLYSDPFIFKPERFMDGEEFSHETQDPEFACWGYGRRICSGRHMAYASIWITIASLLYVFDIQKELDENGMPIEPNPEYRSSVAFTPDSFPCRLTPRSEELARLVMTSLQDRI